MRPRRPQGRFVHSRVPSRTTRSGGGAWPTAPIAQGAAACQLGRTRTQRWLRSPAPVEAAGITACALSVGCYGDGADPYDLRILISRKEDRAALDLAPGRARFILRRQRDQVADDIRGLHLDHVRPFSACWTRSWLSTFAGFTLKIPDGV